MSPQLVRPPQYLGTCYNTPEPVCEQGWGCLGAATALHQNNRFNVVRKRRAERRRQAMLPVCSAGCQRPAWDTGPDCTAMDRCASADLHSRDRTCPQLVSRSPRCSCPRAAAPRLQAGLAMCRAPRALQGCSSSSPPLRSFCFLKYHLPLGNSTHKSRDSPKH